MINLFLVESIVSIRKNLSKTEYLVKWQGYSDIENTWEDEQNLTENCADLIKQYHKNKFFKKFKYLLHDFHHSIIGDINRDRPFYIIRENDTKFLISFYPRKNIFIQSCWIDKNKTPQYLIDEISCKQEQKIEESIITNECIGCILEYNINKSLVVLLENKEKIMIDNNIIIRQQPMLLIDYFDNLKWIKNNI